jgi:hypothetical protein
MRKARSAHLSSRAYPGWCVRRSLGPGCPAAPGRNCLALLPPGPDAVRKLPVRGTWPSTLAPVRPFLGRHPLGREFSPAIAACGFREPLAPRLARPGTPMLALRASHLSRVNPWFPRGPPPCGRRRQSEVCGAGEGLDQATVFASVSLPAGKARLRRPIVVAFGRGTVPVSASLQGLSL